MAQSGACVNFEIFLARGGLHFSFRMAGLRGREKGDVSMKMHGENLGCKVEFARWCFANEDTELVFDTRIFRKAIITTMLFHYLRNNVDFHCSFSLI